MSSACPRRSRTSIIPPNRRAAENSPLLEIFRGKGCEVLFMTDPIDEWIVKTSAPSRKKLVSISKAMSIWIAKRRKRPRRKAARKPSRKQGYDGSAGEILKDKVKEVRFSKLRPRSTCCLVSDEWSMGVQMEKILKAMNQDVPSSKTHPRVEPRSCTLIDVMRKGFA